MRPNGNLVAGALIAIPLAATDTVLLLKRFFPHSIAVNFVGPALSIAGVLLVVRCLKRGR